MKRSLPYSQSKTNPVIAQTRIKEMLRKFGVMRVIFIEDFELMVVAVNFIYKDYPISLPIDYKSLGEMYLKADPYTNRRKCKREEWAAKKHEIAYRASFSLLEDLLKSLITVVELGLFSFEEIFIAYVTNSQGIRFGEVVKDKLPEFVSGELVLTGKSEN